MDQESTPTDAPEGQEPASDEQGQEPESTTSNAESGQEPQTFSADYVKQLRKQAAATRTRLNEAEAQLRELTDRDKSEQQRLTERAAELEARASEAETRLLRFEIAAERGLDAEAATFLVGSTRDEIEASADGLAAYVARRSGAATPAPPRGFDGGARQTPETKGTPEQEHSKLLLGALGRAPR